MDCERRPEESLTLFGFCVFMISEIMLFYLYEEV